MLHYEAGVAGVMCSYNLVNGTPACGSATSLLRDLKRRLRFRGWVITDWWALNSTKAALAGVDMEMPGSAGRASSGNGGSSGDGGFFSKECI